MKITIVVAIGRNGVIGRDGALPWPPTGDLAQFKELTMGHPLVMGRTTFESIGRPLPGRTSIVLTRNRQWSAPGVQVVPDLASGLAAASALDKVAFIIGGAQVYAEALAAHVVDQMVVTHVDASPEGDAWFPDVDWSRWEVAETTMYPGYEIVRYDRRTD